MISKGFTHFLDIISLDHISISVNTADNPQVPVHNPKTPVDREETRRTKEKKVSVGLPDTSTIALLSSWKNGGKPRIFRENLFDRRSLDIHCSVFEE